MEISGRSWPEIFLYKTLRADFAYLLTFMLAVTIMPKQVDWRGVIFQARGRVFDLVDLQNRSEYVRKYIVVRNNEHLNLAIAS